MHRTPFIHGSQFVHRIVYNPTGPGIIYVQRGEHFLYDFIAPDFPFIYFFKHESSHNLASKCPYATFVEDEDHDMDLNSHQQIEDYYKDTKFTQASADQYMKKNFATHQFYGVKLASSDPLDVDYSSFTNNFQDAYWVNAGNLVKDMSISLPNRSNYASFYMSIIEKGLAIITDIFQESLTAKSLEKWSVEVDKIRQGLGASYEMVNKLVEDLVENDKLAEQKRLLGIVFSDSSISTFNDDKAQFEHLLGMGISLPSALYFYANSLGENSGLMTSAIKETRKAIDEFKKLELTEKTFVNVVSLLNFRLLQLMFGELNDLWQKTLKPYMNSIDWKLCWALIDKIEDFYENLPEYKKDKDLLRGFNPKGWIFQMLVQSHPYFAQFYLHFNEVMRPVVGHFYSSESEKIQKYNDKSGDSYDKGPAAFVNEYYRIALKEEDPNQKKGLLSITNEELFTLKKRLLLI
jgi:hypothetical protein